MLLKKTEKSKKQVFLANSNVDKWKKYDGLTILEIDRKEKLVDIALGSSNNIESLVLEFNDHMVAFPLSKGLSKDSSILMDINELTNCQFYLNRKTMRDENGNILEGEDVNPTGPEYISFGKPISISFETLDSLVPVEDEELVKKPS